MTGHMPSKRHLGLMFHVIFGCNCGYSQCSLNNKGDKSGICSLVSRGVTAFKDGSAGGGGVGGLGVTTFL